MRIRKVSNKNAIKENVAKDLELQITPRTDAHMYRLQMPLPN